MVQGQAQKGVLIMGEKVSLNRRCSLTETGMYGSNEAGMSSAQKGTCGPVRKRGLKIRVHFSDWDRVLG